MCGIVGYTGPREAGPILIEGLQRLEYRGYDSAGIALVDDGGRPVRREAGRQAGQPRDGHRRPDPARGDRPRPHPLGHPRPAERPQRPSPPGLHGRDHGHPQRDHRELPRAARRAGGARPQADLRDRHRGARPPRRGGLRGRPRRRRPRGPAPGRGRLRHRGHAPRRGRPAGRRPPGRAARRRARPTARASSPATSRPSSPTPTRSSSSRRATSPTCGRGASTITGRRRRRRASASVTTIDWSPEAAEKGGYEHFMLKEIHEQPEALRQAIAGRVTRDGPHLARGARGLRRDAPPDRPGRAHRLRHGLLRRARRGGGDPGLDRHPGPGHGRLGVPLQPAAARRPDAGHRRDPVRRDGRHDRPDPPRPRARRPGHRGHQHRRQRHHPRGGPVLFLQAGPEIAVAASKTFVAQVTTLVILAAAIAKARGALGAEQELELGAALHALPGGRRAGARERDGRAPTWPAATSTRAGSCSSAAATPTRPPSRARSSSRRSATSTPRAMPPAR